MNKFKLTLLLAFLCQTATSQVLLKDINTANASSNPVSAFDLNGTMLFAANEQFWKSDGTTAGTSMYFDPSTTNTGPRTYNGYTYSRKLKLNGNLLFSTSGYNNSGVFVGTELWKTDGTAAGTSLLADINSGSNGSYPYLLSVAGGMAFFTATDATNGQELWVTDGNTVTFLGDINPGTGSIYLYSDGYTTLGNKLIFIGYNPTYGSELWVSDGTPAGTFLLKDIYPGASSSSIYNLKTIGTKVFFSANTGSSGNELWVTDGTSAGTQMVTDLYDSCLGCSSGPSNFIDLNGTLIFSAYNYTVGTEIWKSDGTALGTTMLKNIAPQNLNSSPADLIKVDNNVFFTADDNSVGRELWVTDGTSAGTKLVKDINLSNNIGDVTFPLDYLKRKFLNVNGTLFFIANSGTEGYELWKSDGTNAGTTLVKDFLPGALSGNYSNYSVVGSKLYFIVEENGSKKLCVSDGTTTGSKSIRAIAPSVNMTNEYPLLGIGNTLYFVAYHSLYGYELYKTDGTAAGTSFLKDMNLFPFSYSSFYAQVANTNAFVFSYDNNINGQGLWKTDGTTSNTQPLLNLNIYPTNYTSSYTLNFYITALVNFNNDIYTYINGLIWKTDGINTPVIFRGSPLLYSNTPSLGLAVSNRKLFFKNPEDGKLWATDGTEAGTYLVKDDANLDPSQMIDVNGVLYFRGYSPSEGYELWKSDGTAAGTVLVKDFNSGTTSSYFSDMVKVGSKIYFSLYNSSTSQYQLWVSDGTSAGTILLRSSLNSISNLTNLSDTKLLFNFNDSITGNELWASDGTVGGTALVKDIYQGSNSSYPNNYTNNRNQFAVYNNRAYFNAYDNNSNPKFYTSDGTNAGTVALANFNSNNITSTPYGLFLSGYTSSIGSELYKSDGTNAGTVLVSDIYQGVNGSSPQNFFYDKNLLYFSATHLTYGTEIFVLKLCDNNLTLSSNTSGSQYYQVNDFIQATNTILPNAMVTYDAGKYIELRPNFLTNQPSSFMAKIQGCVYNPANPPVPGSLMGATTSTPDAVAIARTEAYLNDIKNIPSADLFLRNPENVNLRILWDKMSAEKADIETQLRALDNNKPEEAAKIALLKQRLGDYQQSIQAKKDEKGKIIAYEIILRHEQEMASATLNVP